ncbi:GDSL esterase/lipase At1g58430-like [Hordeum vulgare subsp. vulgare]|uniref:GDSL esterase/lipase n=1 Tax=Hordeum vulgare subsp. vulgare TaxID=112509 RepID=M0VQK2_HORVV|nr:GDSL esterase/lipase At1g58430-like [Hordeum vulgare subsp. vulgare]
MHTSDPRVAYKDRLQRTRTSAQARTSPMAHPVLLLLLALLLLLTTPAISSSKRTQPRFPAIFYFGDSIFDTGNNNHIPTLGLANHPPYGRDFPGSRPTGRFSNGRLVPDLLNERLQLKEFSPPFLDAGLSDKDIMTGVNFASAGSGFDDRTSRVANTMPLSVQVDLFRDEYLPRLRSISGDKEATRIIASSLMFINSGTNDFTRYYRSSKRRVDIGEYQDSVLQLVHAHVKELYKVGGRQFILAGLPPFGCIPFQITLSGDPERGCVDEQNREAQVYNSKLQKLIPALQGSLRGSRIVYLNAYEAFTQIIDNSNKYGFTETTLGCCGTGLTEVGILCNRFTPICRNVSSYIFYDAVHPTERVYRIATDYIVKNVIPQF